MHRPSGPELRAAGWTALAVVRARRQLRGGGLDRLSLRPAPFLTPAAVRGVLGVLRRTRSACLVRSSVLQAWYAGQGERRDLVVGVTPPSGGFRAHAWLDGEAGCPDGQFTELLRRPA